MFYAVCACDGTCISMGRLSSLAKYEALMARLAGPQDPESPFLLPNVVITGILPHTAFT